MPLEANNSLPLFRFSDSVCIIGQLHIRVLVQYQRGPFQNRNILNPVWLSGPTEENVSNVQYIIKTGPGVIF